jgi:MFS family permease
MTEPRAFQALFIRGFLPYLMITLTTMMADNVEHVVSYWVMHQKFGSPALGGFAVIAHWLPYIVLSVPIGALNERLDSRRLIQVGALMFLVVSLAWGTLFATNTLKIWHAMVLLVVHGCAGVFWLTSSQVLLYDIVGGDAIASAVRLGATTRYLGMLVGPAVGSLMLRRLGPVNGMFVNACLYLPMIVWLWRAPYGKAFRAEGQAVRRSPRFRELVTSLGEIRTMPALRSALLLAGAASFCVGNSYQAQMPTFANDLGHGDPGAAYSALLGADAAGAMLAGVTLEAGLRPFRPEPRNALRLAILWSIALCIFSWSRSYSLSVVVLFAAGFCELSFSSLAQTVVQLEAPDAIRGRVLGLYSMAALGLRTFSGVIVGLLGSAVGVHISLGTGAILLMLICFGLLVQLGSAPKAAAKEAQTNRR